MKFSTNTGCFFCVLLHCFVPEHPFMIWNSPGLSLHAWSVEPLQRRWMPGNMASSFSGCVTKGPVPFRTKSRVISMARSSAAEVVQPTLIGKVKAASGFKCKSGKNKSICFHISLSPHFGVVMRPWLTSTASARPAATTDSIWSPQWGLIQDITRRTQAMNPPSQ